MVQNESNGICQYGDKRTLRFPIGVQSFEELRTGGYVYVDKTGFIPSLLQNKYYFFSRPRRFGKSLLLSTFEAYFKGQRHLFDGLAISEWEKEWMEYPVVHIDFNTMQGTDTSELIATLKDSLIKIAESYDINEPLTGTYSAGKDAIGFMFSRLIQLLSEKFGKKVVVLIDEYDKGLIEVINDEASREAAADRLRPFFNVLKTEDRNIRFAFITGVSRFRNTTIFSGVNNLSDISMEKEYSTLLGITHSEMESYFKPAIKQIADEYDCSYDIALELLRNKYDGYRFTRGPELVYNPFSLLNAFRFRNLGDYWISSGSSKILASYLRKSDFRLDEIISSKVPANILGSTYSSENPVSLFFQTGYLSIDDHDRLTDEYTLKIPNQEVQHTMTELVIPEYASGINEKDVSSILAMLRGAILKGDVDSMMYQLQYLLSKVPYQHIDKPYERHLHLCMEIIFMMLGVNAKSEISMSGGRIDMVAMTPWHVYVFEFKIDESPESALRQIDEKGYAIPWHSGGRKVTKIGVRFSSRLHTIESWKTNT